MVTIKSYSDLQQSKKLAEILPHESADMKYKEYTSSLDYSSKHLDIPSVGHPFSKDIPCWSLASLLEQLPYEVCDDDGNSLYLQIDKEDDVYQLVYTDPHGDFESIETDRYEHFVDACYEMIIRINKLKML